MGSLGSGELIVIAIVVLVVFGPKRLPELARKAADLLKQAREATQTLTNAIDTEYDDITAPLKDLKAEYDETMQTIKKMAPIPDLSVQLPDGRPDKKQSAVRDQPSEEEEPSVDEPPSADRSPPSEEEEPSVDEPPSANSSPPSAEEEPSAAEEPSAISDPPSAEEGPTRDEETQ